MAKNSFNYGWIVVYEYLVHQDSFWDEMGGVFFPANEWLKGKKNVCFTIDGVSHIFGWSDFFEDFDGEPFLAPSYDAIFDELECFSAFARIPMPL